MLSRAVRQLRGWRVLPPAAAGPTAERAWARDTLYFGVFFFIGANFAWGAGGVVRVEGPSMLPLLQPDDRLVWVRWRWWWQAEALWRRVASAATASNAAPHVPPLEWLQGRPVIATLSPTRQICKRVGPVGYVPPDVGPGAVWLLGDNAPRSTDSRHHGAVPLAAVEGVALGILWPPSRCGWVA